MTRRTKSTAAAVVGFAVLGGAGAAIAAGNNVDRERPIVGRALDRARSVALHQVVGEGRVTATEVGDEEGAYEIEVARGDGSAVDVHLDSSFGVIDVSPDGPADGADARRG